MKIKVAQAVAPQEPLADVKVANDDKKKNSRKGRFHHKKQASGDDNSGTILNSANASTLIRFNDRLDKTEKGRFQLVKTLAPIALNADAHIADAVAASTTPLVVVSSKQHKYENAAKTKAQEQQVLTLSFDNFLDKLMLLFPSYKQLIKEFNNCTITCRLGRDQSVPIKCEDDLLAAIEKVQKAKDERKQNKKKNDKKKNRRAHGSSKISLKIKIATGAQSPVAKDSLVAAEQEEKPSRRRHRGGEKRDKKSAVAAEEAIAVPQDKNENDKKMKLVEKVAVPA